MKEQTSAVLTRIEKTSANWKRLYRFWWAVHYGVGIIGIIAGLLAGLLGKDVATAADNWDKMFIIAPGAIAALCATLVTFLGPVQKAERYWQAFHTADQALMDFEAGSLTLAQVSDSMRTARKVVLIGPSGNRDEIKQSALSGAPSREEF